MTSRPRRETQNPKPPSRPGKPRHTTDARHTPEGDELLRHVEDWDDGIRRYLEEQLEALEKEEPYIPLAALYLAEQTIEDLSDPVFRERYIALLGESGRAAEGHFMASDPKRGRSLIRELGVVSVIPPPKRPRQQGEIPAHQFPRPVVHHRPRTRRKGAQNEPENIRLLLDHITFLGAHPQYLLVCTWPSPGIPDTELGG